ncbi:MAG: hypothetical protein AMS20_13935 [Gemmatimonas sp. SG8_28]|nr:MAG: hypothetical protein AMS20_13935 [Gemmatimonas sp. SG8_28]
MSAALVSRSWAFQPIVLTANAKPTVCFLPFTSLRVEASIDASFSASTETLPKESVSAASSSRAVSVASCA